MNPEDYMAQSDCPECGKTHQIDMRGKHLTLKYTAWVDCENCGARFGYTKIGYSRHRPRPYLQEVEEYRIWDPGIVGPFDRCIICFTPNTENFAFCSYCGHISTVFDTPRDATDTTCHNHKSSNAIGYCCLCNEPICEECNSKEKEHFSLTAGFRDLYYCQRCVQKSQAIEQTFLQATKEEGFCAKHHKEISTFECIKCGLLLCPSCSYFKNAGWFRKKVGEGPYCLVCFRGATYKGGRSRWISGGEAITKGLLT